MWRPTWPDPPSTWARPRRCRRPDPRRRGRARPLGADDARFLVRREKAAGRDATAWAGPSVAASTRWPGCGARPGGLAAPTGRPGPGRGARPGAARRPTGRPGHAGRRRPPMVDLDGRPVLAGLVDQHSICSPWPRPGPRSTCLPRRSWAPAAWRPRCARARRRAPTAGCGPWATTWPPAATSIASPSTPPGSDRSGCRTEPASPGPSTRSGWPRCSRRTGRPGPQGSRSTPPAGPPAACSASTAGSAPASTLGRARPGRPRAAGWPRRGVTTVVDASASNDEAALAMPGLGPPCRSDIVAMTADPRHRPVRPAWPVRAGQDPARRCRPARARRARRSGTAPPTGCGRPWPSTA